MARGEAGKNGTNGAQGDDGSTCGNGFNGERGGPGGHGESGTSVKIDAVELVPLHRGNDRLKINYLSSARVSLATSQPVRITVQRY